MLSDGSHSYTFDAESRITSGAGVSFVYNGDGERVQKSDGTTYWGGGAGSALLETDNSGNPKAEYVFFNGKRLARRDLPGGSIKLYFADNLGSASVISDTSGNLLESYDYAPYGELHATSGSDSNHYLFGGKERDSETGLDYFGARYYGNALGRWMSPDWAAKPTSVPYASFGDPQTLNLYAYVANRPIVHMDADGHAGADQQDAWYDMRTTGEKSLESYVMDGGAPGAGTEQAYDKQVEDGRYNLAVAEAAKQQNPNGAGGIYSGNQAINLNLGGGTTVTGNFGNYNTTGSPYPAEEGVYINADSNCSGCQWVQIVNRTGADATTGLLDNQASSGTPFYPYQDSGKAGSFHDQPGNYMRGDWSAGGGTFSAVSVLGVANSSNHTFKPIGAISWGYSVDSHGKLTSRAPVSSPGAVKAAMAAMHAAMPSWTGN